MSRENGRLRSLSSLCLSNYLDVWQCYLLLARCHHLDRPAGYVHLGSENSAGYVPFGLIESPSGTSYLGLTRSVIALPRGQLPRRGRRHHRGHP